MGDARFVDALGRWSPHAEHGPESHFVAFPTGSGSIRSWRASAAAAELVRPGQPCTVVVPGRSVPHQGWLEDGTNPFFWATMYHPHDLAGSCPKLVA